MFAAHRFLPLFLSIAFLVSGQFVAAQSSTSNAKSIALPPLNLKVAQALIIGALKEKTHWSNELKTAIPAFRITTQFAPKDPAYPENQVGAVQIIWSKVPGGATIVEDYSMLLRTTSDRKAWSLLPSDLLITASILKELPLPSKNVLLQTVLKGMRGTESSTALFPEANRIVAFHLVDAYPTGIQTLEQSFTFSKSVQNTWSFEYSITVPLILDYEFLQPNIDGTFSLMRKSGQFGLVLQRPAGALSWSLSTLALVGLPGKFNEVAVNNQAWPSRVLEQMPNLATDGLDLVWGRQSAYTSTFKVPD